MSNGDDVLDDWEEIDEAGLCMRLETKLQIAKEDDTSIKIKPASTAEPTGSKMKLLQRPQALQESSNSAAAAITKGAPKQIMIAKKPTSSPTLDADLTTAPVMMVLHKSSSEYDAATYATPINNQTVKILRRPAQAEERRDPNDLRPKQPIKTLQQREQEYAQARLRILGSAKNPEDDKPATPTTAVSTTSVVLTTQTAELPAATNSFSNNNGNIVTAAPGMHRSSSAPKMSQTAPVYNNYKNYYQAPPTPAAMSYYYQQQQQQTSAIHQQQQQQMLQAPPHYSQGMPPYVAGAAGASPAPTNPQQSWSPVVGGSVSAALLRQQSLHTPSMQQQQQQHHQHQQQQHQQYAHQYNDNVLRLPRGPCPNGTIGFQMRR